MNPTAQSMKRLLSFSLDVCITRTKAVTHREQKTEAAIPRESFKIFRMS